MPPRSYVYMQLPGAKRDTNPRGGSHSKRQVKEGGEEVLDGFEMMQRFFDHLQINFSGAVLAIIGLQAEVGQIFTSALFGGAAEAAKAAASEAAFAQAAANTILAHLVSIMFLSYMIRKISYALQAQVEWSMELRQTVAKLGSF
mmetsp:Transcript_3456/g.9949  ORF Transcript_3456/g.9949 Transcript_3456/m.9949 type:complete len:144 (-) Transcript_3456:1275-1706(-)